MMKDRSSIVISYPLSLLGMLSLTLDKMCRDGIIGFTRKLRAVCESEPPLAAIARHREVVAFFNQPAMPQLKSRLFANKYLGGYLAKSIGKRARREILLHHYRRVLDRAEPDFLPRVLSGSYRLWGRDDAQASYSITLGFDTHAHYEGDFLVSFMSGSQQILRISCSIVPGSAVGSDIAELLFVGHVQGVRHKFAEIRQATKACRDVAPQHMLMIAIQSIAHALDIDVIAGVTDENQLTRCPANNFKFQYDSFWENWDGRRTANFYELPIPLRKTVSGDVQSAHRRRTRKKREFKSKVAAEIAGQLDAIFPWRRNV